MGIFGARLSLLALVWAGAAGAACQPDAVEFRGASGAQRFSVEIADDASERETGLMYRAAMPKSSGMLFVYPSPHHAVFWMKNTLIPLDMIFVDAAGRVVKVHENAIPQDLTGIDGGDAVTFVLEINGGLARPMGIAPGSEMRSPLIEQSAAVWPCSDD